MDTNTRQVYNLIEVLGGAEFLRATIAAFKEHGDDHADVTAGPTYYACHRVADVIRTRCADIEDSLPEAR